MLEIYAFINTFSYASLDLEMGLVGLQSELMIPLHLNLIPLTNFQWFKGAKKDQLVSEMSTDQACLTSYQMTLDIKAAQFQGKRIARNFMLALQKLVEKNQSYNDELVNEALALTNVDIAEFKKDRESELAKHSIQMDQRIAHEMGVVEANSIIVFNTQNDEAALVYDDVNMQQIEKILLDNPQLRARMRMN